MVTFQILTPKDIKRIVPLIQELNPELDKQTIESNQKEMFSIANYRCFGLFKERSFNWGFQWMDYRSALFWKTNRNR